MTSMIDNGIHPAVSRERYDSIERVNFSSLKYFARSPKHYHHRLTAPSKDTDAMKLGRVVHIAAFEPERFLASIAVWDGGVRRGKDWDAFKARNEGRELLTENEHETCLAVRAAVQADAVASAYVEKGRGEVSLLWSMKVNGEEIKAKGRVDFLAAAALVDLKTTRDASPHAFGRQAFALHYATQAAWYVDALAAVTGKTMPYVIVAVENEPPHVVQAYRVPDELLEIGRAEYKDWLDKLQFCRANSFWPAYSDRQEFDLTYPPWAYPHDDEDLSGEGLTSGGVPLISEG